MPIDASVMSSKLAQFFASSRRRKIAGLIFISAFVALLSIRMAMAQQVSSVIATGYRVQLETYPEPNETQIKTLLEGRNAEPQPGGRILLIEPQLSRFLTNGVLELQVRSPECVFNIMARTISSTNTLEVEMANGRFFTRAKGFLSTTNSTLFLSNQVHTIIRMPARTFKNP